MIYKEAIGAFPFCDNGNLPCYTRWNGATGPEGICYNPLTHVCRPVSGGDSIVCSFSDGVCGKQCYQIGGGKTCWMYGTLCDRNQSPCIMSELQKGQCYDFFKERCFAKVVCSNNQTPCSSDATKCCAAGK